MYMSTPVLVQPEDFIFVLRIQRAREVTWFAYGMVCKGLVNNIMVPQNMSLYIGKTCFIVSSTFKA